MNVIQRLDLASYRMSTPKKSKAVVKAVLECHFEAITLSNVAWLNLNPDAPNLYDSGVRYRRDPERALVAELWLDVPNILRRGFDDCEGLASFLAAELRAKEDNSLGKRRYPAAAVWLKPTRIPGSWHAIVKDHETGQLWDPSRALGMGRNRRKQRGRK
jgi:hypothetical protein